MPADVADIAAASRAAVSASWSSATIAARYPNARDGTVTPATGHFDAIADAQVVTDARGLLLGRERRRFAVEVQELLWIDVESGVPVVQLVDLELSANVNCIAARIEPDLETETTSLELFG